MFYRPHAFFLALLLLSGATASEAGVPFGKDGAVPLRSEIPEQFKWKLQDIFASDAAWNAEYDAIRAELPKLAALQGTLKKSADALFACFKLRDDIGERLGKLYVYASMKSHEDTSDSTYQAMSDKAGTLATEYFAAASYIMPEMLEIPEPTLVSYANSDKPGFKPYRFGILEIIRQKAHVLPHAQEELLAKTGDMAATPENAFSMLTNADMKFPFIKDEAGRKVELTEERYIKYIASRNRSVRRAAYKGLYETYGRNMNTIGATFNGMLKSTHFYSDARKYPSDIAAALDGPNIPLSVYNNLVDTVESNLAPLHRYMALRKKILNLKELDMYDVYVPLTENPYKDIPWDEAKKMAIEALAPLGEQYIVDFKNGLDSGWIDVYANKGKRGGAYSSGSYGTHPYILLNYNNELNDVSTLVHEMGHSMHTFYSHKNQPYPTADYVIFCAEVASTTNEELLLNYLLSNAADKQKKIYLLNQRLERIRTTVYRQTMFASFERDVHALAAEGGDTTAAALSKMWHKLNVKYFGPSVEVDELIDREWARIPHFYSPFYVYQYATGYSAAAALAKAIVTQGEPAREEYLAFLSSGGSDYPIALLKRAGVDMNTPQPILDTIALFNSTLDEMEKLLSE